MTICPKCEKPIKDGKARGEYVVDFQEDPTGLMHGVKIVSEIWLEHLECHE